MKVIYGATFDFIVKKVNDSIQGSTVGEGEEGEAGGYLTVIIGMLDIFLLETFACLCSAVMATMSTSVLYNMMLPFLPCPSPTYPYSPACFR